MAKNEREMMVDIMAAAESGDMDRLEDLSDSLSARSALPKVKKVRVPAEIDKDPYPENGVKDQLSL